MVKYLSDQRNDPYYQTKLSLSQPFQAEVPEQIYPVDEVDLSPALGMIEAGARAYYAHQGEELERENLGISYSMYQAGRAKEKAQTAAAEKEKGLKNTMLNDYAIAISREVLDPYMQDRDKMSPVAAERKLRDIREQYIRMTGGVLNASDLMKIEKDSGVTFTKDLYQADLQRQNEAYKRDIEDINRVGKNLWDQVYGEGASNLVDQKTMNQFYAKTLEAFNGLEVSVQNDFTLNSATPDANATQGSNMSYTTRQKFGEVVTLAIEAMKDSALNDTDPEYLRADQMLKNKEAMMRAAKDKVVEVNGQKITMATLYGEKAVEGVVNIAWMKSGIEKPYTDEQKRRTEFSAYVKDKADTAVNRNKIREADIKRKELIARAQLQEELSPTGLYMLEHQNILMNLDAINSDKAAAYRALVGGEINLKNIEGDLGPRSDGRTMRNIANKVMKKVGPQEGIAVKSANVEAGRRALNNTPTDGYVPYSIWDVPSAHAAMEDRENTLLNGNEIPSDPNTEQKQKNTELHRDLYLKARRNPEIWESLSAEDQQDMTRSYAFDTHAILRRGFNLLRENGLSENIAYDTKKSMFVPINFDGAAGSEKEMLLWKVVDNMNNATSTGIQDLDKAFLDSQRTWVRDVTDEDRITQKSSSAQLGEALFGSDVINTKKVISKVPGSIVEGMQRVGETTTKGALWLAEKGSKGAVLAAMYGYGKAQEAGEAVADVVDFITNPNRTYVGEFKQAVKNAVDSFADYVLEDTDLTEEQKEEAKQEFREQIKDAVNVAKEEGEDFLKLIGYNNTERDRQVQQAVNVVYDTVTGAKDKLVKTFGDMYETYKLGKQYGRMSSIPAYNLGIIARIMGGDKNVSKEEAEASLEAMKKAPVSDLMSLDANFDIGMFDLNTRARVEEYINTLDKHEKKRESVSGKVDNMAPMNAEAIYNIAKGAKNVSKEEAEAALKAWDKATISDKRVIERNLNMYSSEIKKALEDAAK